MYTAFCNQVRTARNLWDLMVARRLKNRIEARLYELHDADKISGLIAMQYVVEMEQYATNLQKQLNIQNQN